MVYAFRLLIISNSDNFRTRLVDWAGILGLSVKAIGFAPELPTALEAHGFDWVVLDLDMGQDAAFEAVEGLARTGARLFLVGADEVALAAARAAAALNGLEVAKAASGPLSMEELGEVVARRTAPSPGLAHGAAHGAAGGDLAAAPILESGAGIPEDEVEVHYQPLMCFQTGRALGVEALVRWRHPVHGLLSPSRFIALAERNGSIVPLTWTVLRHVVRQHAAWKKAGITLAVSVNVSALFLAALETAEALLDLLRDEGFDPRELTLEITETEAARNPPLANALLRRLRDSGVAVAMDDYGVGFSTLQRLKLFPFSNLKIDRWLVADLASDPQAQRTVRMLVALGQEQNFTLTGEGIETEEQWRILRDLGCDYGQGYLIARPMPAQDVATWLVAKTGATTRPSLAPC
ncbi:MAG: EAL domain-containing protein [Alphaproteobacteria bacterium]|nr:EAL domain-containing protein [Alphaproteobacteria bacterium]MBV8406812.1 EAL domain-containing protein [Alphaproteobacteria bacterium]